MMFMLLLCLGHCLPGADSQGSVIQACVKHNVTLLCDGPSDAAKEKFQWIFKDEHVGYLVNGRWVGQNTFKTRAWPVSIEKNNFSLVIASVSKEDEGTYRCDIGKEERSIKLSVVESGPVCRTNKESEDPPGSKTEDKRDSDENHAGPSTGVIVVIVLVVLAVVAAGAAVLIKLWRKRETDENPTDCIQFFHACGKEGEKKRGKNLPDPGPSEDALI